MIEVVFRQLLTNDTATAALVDDRVYFINRPQDERRPSIVLTLISSVPGMTFQGRGGYVTGNMQVNCLAPTYPQAKALADAARNALDAFKGTQDGTDVCYILSDGIRDIAAMPLVGSAAQATFGVAIDFKFMFKESVSV